MDDTDAARALDALGNVKRLAIYRLLVRAGDDGLAVGDVQRALGIPASTLSHHVAWLGRAGLVTQERQGREIRCRADYGVMHALVDFLTDSCCVGVRPAANDAETDFAGAPA
jgi:ArsR family transcriptional regulator, arsenate/arsenite/antimonite-responsive transcriptional repressor